MTRYVHPQSLGQHDADVFRVGGPCEEQVEVRPEGRHDPCQRQGLPFRQVHWVCLALLAVVHHC